MWDAYSEPTSQPNVNPVETQTTDLQKMAKFEALSKKVLAIMAKFDWSAGRGYLAGKNFKTIQVGQTAVAYLYPDDGYNNTVAFHFFSEGRNVCSTSGTLIPVGASDEVIDQLVSKAVINAEEKIAGSFAVRALDFAKA